MTQLLVSVRTPQEALMALQSGADIIDLKDPAAGALGALPAEMIDKIVRLIDGRVPISATVGDVPLDSDDAMYTIEHTSRAGVDIVKAGFFDRRETPGRWVEELQPYASSTRLIAVLFADEMPDVGILSELKQAGFYGVMLDTITKNGKSLEDYVPMDLLKDFLELANHHGLVAGLAGSLRMSHIPLLAPLKPDYLGFRGGLCEQLSRTGSLLPGRVEEAKKLLRENNNINEYAGWA